MHVADDHEIHDMSFDNGEKAEYDDGNFSMDTYGKEWCFIGKFEWVIPTAWTTSILVVDILLKCCNLKSQCFN